MFARRKSKPLPRHVLSLFVLVASLLNVLTMVAWVTPRPPGDRAAGPTWAIDHESNRLETHRAAPKSGRAAQSSAAALAGTREGLASRAEGARSFHDQVNPTTTSTLAQTATPTATIVPDANLHIRHERGLAEYDSVVQDGSDLVQSSTAALGGTQGGLHVTVHDATAVYGKRAFGALTGATAYRFRHYVDPNGLSMPDGSEITLTQLRGGSNKVETRLQYGAGCYRLYVRYVDDQNTWRSLPTAFIADAGHYIEVLVEFASGPTAHDGRITYWIDDLAIGRHKSLDLYDKLGRPDHLHLGAPWVSDATVRGTLYVDEFVLRDDAEYIGPEDSQPAMPGVMPALSKTVQP